MLCAMMALASLAATATAVQAEDLVITSFTGNGEVTWVQPTNGVAQYRIEWCPDPAGGLWSDLDAGLSGIAPTGGTMTAAVPLVYRIRALGPEPANMAYVPPGWFDMGNGMDPSEGQSDELPVHRVFVSGFHMDRYEVSSNLWHEVRTWALGNGYSFEHVGDAEGTDHPVHTVSWYDCVKWANARSQKEGLTPCYYVDAGHTILYTSGVYPLADANVDWSANGYRLPTEAEWEKAARGGAAGYRFPWADDTISHGRANYHGSPATYSYDLGPAGYHPDYKEGTFPYTSPVGAFAPNGYGLYDVAGNLFEWCWDWHDSNYYASSPATNPRGPSSRSYRVRRGGEWQGQANYCRVADRNNTLPEGAAYNTGFRLVRNAQ